MKMNSSSKLPAPAGLAAAIRHFGFPVLTRAVSRRSVLMAMALVIASLTAPAQNETSTTVNLPEQTATNAVAAEAQTPTPAVAAPTQEVAPANTVASKPDAGVTTGTSTNGLDLNFRNTSIDQVLNYLSDAAGFIVQINGKVSGYVTVRGKNLTKDEAVDLLNTALIKNGYGAIRNGRRLTIMTAEEIVTSGNPVKVINNISDLENNDEMITAIIPIRFVEASQLVSELSTFVSSTRIVANQAGNSIVITDTQANIRHLVEIAKAIDSSAEDVTEVRVFHLDYADPTETANLLTSLFQDQGTGAQSPIRFAGGRGGRGGFGGRGGGAFGAFNPFAAFAGANAGGANSQTERIRQRKQVVAQPDPRTSSVIVVATRDLLDQIQEMIIQLDHQGKQVSLVVIPLKNSNASDVMQALQDTVGATTSRNQNRNTDPFVSRVQLNNSTMGTSTFGTGTTGRRGGGNTGFGGGQ